MNWLVFVFSLVASSLMLLIERLVGIDWDFHPDSVTYATLSNEVASMVLDEGPAAFVNNSYYVLCALLDESVFLITIFNIIVFSATNLIIYKLASKPDWHKCTSLQMVAVISLLLFNPYRLHLSTTLLKDTLIIFLLVWSVQSYSKSTLGFFVMPLFRAAGVLYYSLFINKRLYRAGVAFLMLAFLMLPDFFVNQIEIFNANEMQFREFDTIPTFQEYGLLGSFLRALTWPLLFCTGLFAVLSPSLPYIMVALGIWLTLIYIYYTNTKLSDFGRIYLILFAFGIMVTGYSSYIRYVYPLVVVMPLLRSRNEKI